MEEDEEGEDKVGRGRWEGVIDEHVCWSECWLSSEPVLFLVWFQTRAAACTAASPLYQATSWQAKKLGPLPTLWIAILCEVAIPSA